MRGYKRSDLGYSLQANRRTNEGKSHPDRDAQFLFIYKKVKNFQRNKQPVISVDTKKKELVGNYKNQGKEWNLKKKPIDVDTYDFPDPKLPKAAPYGVYDITKNEGWVSVGIIADTAEFAVTTIKKWWVKMGKKVTQMQRKFISHLIVVETTVDALGYGRWNYKNWRIEFIWIFTFRISHQGQVNGIISNIKCLVLYQLIGGDVH